ncbi:MAG TPA: PA14 domain-containing protein, partial [Paludibacter sp.]|nr:PA14 domain-containing protein [Paludibacter sp.]
YINSDNGRRLWVNDQLIIDKWLSDYGIEYSGSISLSANQKYNIKLEYFEDAGGASCKLEWMNSQQPREVVPKSQLFPKTISAVENNYANKNINIYPNPVTNGVMHVNLTDFTSNDPLKITLYDTLGKAVLQSSLNTSGNISLNGVPSGMYLVSFRNSETNENKRIIIR